MIRQYLVDAMVEYTEQLTLAIRAHALFPVGAESEINRMSRRVCDIDRILTGAERLKWEEREPND